MLKYAIAFTTLLVPGAASAHPNHVAGDDFGIVHYLTDPFHIALTVAAVLLAFSARRLVQQRRSINRTRP